MTQLSTAVNPRQLGTLPSNTIQNPRIPRKKKKKKGEIRIQGSIFSPKIHGESSISGYSWVVTVKLTTTFQPQMDGQVERTIQTLEDMLRSCVIDFKGNWDDHLPLIEFAYNNSYHSSIDRTPFKAFYDRRCRSRIALFEDGEAALIGLKLVHEAIEKIWTIRERLSTTQSWKKSYADVRMSDLEFEVHDWIYLKISLMKGVMSFGKKGKLSTRFVGLYGILRRVAKVSYELDFP
ncbi:hypothetical protein MTR67_043671 [Solanum verrucosum]|nr:hypothetical protein MTR67_043671 [Solanum verrucosum]